MGKIHKRVKKLFLLVLAFVLVAASGIIASASGGSTPMSKVEFQIDGKKTTSYTLYTNEDAVIGEIEDYQKPANAAQGDPKFVEMSNINDTITLDVVTWKKDQKAPSNSNEHFYTVSSNNQRVANVVKSGDGQITITAKGNGTATITLKDKYSTKKATIKVTVKTLVDGIAFSETSVDENNVMKVGIKGSLSLGAVVNPDNRNAASAPKLTYKILPGKEGMSEADAKKIASVSSKGVVTGKAVGTVRVLVTAQDQTGTYTTDKNKTANVKVGYSEVITVEVSNEPVLTSLKGVDKTVDMKANVADSRHTYIFDVYATGEDGTRVENSSENLYYTFASSKTSVATVDPVTGKITAVGTGTAKITAAPADGTKSVKAVTLTVKVTTDPDKINVPSENVMVPLKSGGVSIGATVDKTVSSKEKKLLYEVVSCETKDGESVPVTETGNPAYFVLNTTNGKITPNKTGMVECDAVVKITSALEDWAGVPRYVHIHLVDPVKTLKARVESVSGVTTKGDNVEKTLTLYVGEGEYNKATVTPVITTANGKDKVADGRITYTSNKPAVATVDAEGNVTAHAKGTATITIAANDGSKKKTTVTIKVVKMVTDIDIANAVYNEETGEYSVAVLRDTKKVTLGVTMNTDANTRTVDYNWGEGVSEGKKNVLTLATGIQREYTCTITATDSKISVPKGTSFFKTVTVHINPVDSVQLVDAKYLTMKKGDKITLQTALFDTVNKDTRWVAEKIDQAGVLTVKDGVVTAKKAGEMEVVYQIKDNNEWKTCKTYWIQVTESQAEFEKDLDNKIKALVSAEDYTVWTGMKPTFNAKTGTITMTLKKVEALNMSNFIYNEDELFGAVKEGDLEPVKRVVKTNFEDELRALFTGIEEGVLDSTYTGVELTSDNSAWSLVRGSNNWVVRKGETEIGTFGLADYKDAINVLVKEMAQDAADWSGRSIAVKLMRTLRTKYGLEDYEKTYTLALDSVSNTQVDTLVDDKIVTAVDTFNRQGKEEITGLESIDYVASSNLAVVKISDPGKPIVPESAADKVNTVADNWDVELDAILKRIVNLSKDVNAAAKKAAIMVSDYDNFKDRDQVVVKDIISRYDVEDISTEAVFAKLKAELAERGYTKLGDLGTTMVSVKATVDYDGMTFTQEYHVIFKVVAESEDLIARDQEMDAAISALAGRTSGKAPFGDVTYDGAVNTLNVVITNGKATIEGDILNKGTNFPTLIETILQIKREGDIGKYQKDVEVVARGSRHNYKTGWMVTDDMLPECLGIYADNGLQKLNGEKITVKVYEETGVLTYTINFTVEESNAKSADDPAENEAQTFETTEEVVGEEPVVVEEPADTDAEETESTDAVGDSQEELTDETADEEAVVEVVDEEPAEVVVPEVEDSADAA